MTPNGKAILAATDLSRPAFAAVRRAALVAVDRGASLELLHVVTGSFGAAEWNDLRAATGLYEKDILQAATSNLQALVTQIETELGIRANALVVQGRPHLAIAERSEALDAELVVVGAHGENMLMTPLLGTTAHRVLNLVQKPVLLVKQTPGTDESFRAGYKQILVATDFGADAARAAVLARQLFPAASGTLFHAYQVPFESKLSRSISQARLEGYRKRAAEHAHSGLATFADATGWGDCPRVVRHGPPGMRVREYAREVAADLIVIGSEEMSRLRTALLGSVSLDLITDAACDILLARTPSVT
jgi:nucleotide-binding universal stress UspA family protein